MEVNIISQMKNKSAMVIRNIPAFCQRWNDVEVVVNFNQGVVQLVHRPHHGLRFCKGRIKTRNTTLLIVMKNIAFLNCIPTGKK